MNAGKSTALLQASHNYQERGMNTLIITSKKDDRGGQGNITSRIGLSKKAEVFDEKLLFKKGDWEVVLLRYDDRSTACIARNGLGNKEFQIYVNADVD